MSSTTVTGPSFTRLTSIRAPKTPVCTGTPSSRSASQNRSYRGSATSGRAAFEKSGRAPLLALAIGDERELAHDQGLAGDVHERTVEATAVVLEDPQAGDLGRKAVALAGRVRPGDAEQHDEAEADVRDRLAADHDRRVLDALHDGAHALLQVCAVGRTRPERAAELDVRRGLLATTLVDERTTEGVVRELVGGRELDECAELGFRLLPAADPEVRDAERLAYRP